MGQKFFLAKNSNVCNNRWLVIQCHQPRFVGVVYQFSKTDNGEEHRRALLAETDPYFIAKARGHRLYVVAVGCLRPYLEPEGDEWKVNMHNTLREMADFAVEEMPRGMKKCFEDSTDCEE